jgi:hypothetical protein
MTLYTTPRTLNLLVLPMDQKENFQWKNFIQYIEWNLNSTKFNFSSAIELKFNQRKMGCKLLENQFKIFLWICYWKGKTFKRHKYEKTPFHAFSFWNGLNKFLVSNNLWNLNLSYLNQLWWIIIIGIYAWKHMCVIPTHLEYQMGRNIQRTLWVPKILIF